MLQQGVQTAAPLLHIKMNTAVASVLADVTRRVGRGSDLFRYVRHEFYSANKDFDLHDRNGRWVLRARGGVMEFVMDDGHVRGAATHPVRDASDAVPAADGVLGVVRRHAELVTLAECYEALVRHAPLPPDRARARTQPPTLTRRARATICRPTALCAS